MLLCDFAEEVNGKLYIVGGGWSMRVVQPQALMSVAIKLAVGWNEANERLNFTLRLVTEDGQPVDPGTGPIEITGTAVVGRPPQVTPGTDLDSAMAITLGLPLGVGAYRWEFTINGQPLAQEPFVVTPPGGPRL